MKPPATGIQGMTTSRFALSVCMIVKNEAHQLGEALDNFADFADELVVVDTGSRDDTQVVASRFTPYVYHFPWCDDFSAARNFSLEKARGRYVLWLDADDRFEPAMQGCLRELKKHFSTGRAFYFILENVDETGPSWSCYQLRCVPNRPDVRFEGRVHEQLYPSVERAGIEGVLTDIVVRHYGYRERGKFLEKTRRNLAILDKERLEGRDDEHVHYYRALAQEALGLFPQAVSSMERALVHLERRIHQRFGDNPSPDLQSVLEGYLFLARNYHRLGEIPSARRNLLRANALADEDSNVSYRLGCMFQKLGLHLQALECFGKALSTGTRRVRFHPSDRLPPPATLHLHRAFSLFCMNRETEGLRALEEVSSRGISPCEMFEWLGLRALQGGEYQLSLQFYRAARQRGELSSDGLCNLGLIQAKLGDVCGALECYDAAIEKTPGHPAALANRAHLHFRMNEWDKAEKEFEALVRDRHRDLDLLLPLALISLKKGNRNGFARAERLIFDQVSPPPAVRSSEDRFRWLGDVLDAERKGMPAVWARQIARELGPDAPPGSHFL